MCNCYDDKCFRCGLTIPMHLSDFDTDPGEIRIVCATTPQTRPLICGGPGSIKFAWRGYTEVSFRENGHKPWKRIRIYSLTRNAWSHRHGNMPNCNYKDEVFIENTGG